LFLRSTLNRSLSNTAATGTTHHTPRPQIPACETRIHPDHPHSMHRHLFLLGLTLITLTAQAQDTDGWKTILATKQELKDYPKEQATLEDGLLHVRNGQGIFIPQTSPDGAIRARVHFREGTGFPQLRIRRSTAANPKDADYYNLILYIRPGQTTIKEGIIDLFTQGKTRRVGTFPLPEPFVLGTYLDLEISTLGDHLQVLVNGKLAFQLTDTTITTGGLWGVASQEAWFSNIQVRTFPPSPASAATKLTQSSDPRIQQLQEAYTAAIARDITPAHLEAVQSLDTQYTAALDRALEAVTQAGKLEDALALRTEKKRVEDHAPLPAADAPSPIPSSPSSPPTAAASSSSPPSAPSASSPSTKNTSRPSKPTRTNSPAPKTSMPPSK
jgi:hypothetical protein